MMDEVGERRNESSGQGLCPDNLSDQGRCCMDCDLSKLLGRAGTLVGETRGHITV